jgi:hypothetical protein
METYGFIPQNFISDIRRLRIPNWDKNVETKNDFYTRMINSQIEYENNIRKNEEKVIDDYLDSLEFNRDTFKTYLKKNYKHVSEMNIKYVNKIVNQVKLLINTKNINEAIEIVFRDREANWTEMVRHIEKNIIEKTYRNDLNKSRDLRMEKYHFKTKGHFNPPKQENNNYYYKKNTNFKPKNFPKQNYKDSKSKDKKSKAILDKQQKNESLFEESYPYRIVSSGSGNGTWGIHSLQDDKDFLNAKKYKQPLPSTNTAKIKKIALNEYDSERGAFKRISRIIGNKINPSILNISESFFGIVNDGRIIKLITNKQKRVLISEWNDTLFPSNKTINFFEEEQSDYFNEECDDILSEVDSQDEIDRELEDFTEQLFDKSNKDKNNKKQEKEIKFKKPEININDIDDSQSYCDTKPMSMAELLQPQVFENDDSDNESWLESDTE